MGIRAGAVIASLWAIGLGSPSSFRWHSRTPRARVLQHLADRATAPFDFVDLYIPSNPFFRWPTTWFRPWSCSRSVVGVALIGVAERGVAGRAADRHGGSVAGDPPAVRLTPYGLFAIAATTAGTLSIEQSDGCRYISYLCRCRIAPQPVGPSRAGRGTDADPHPRDVQPDTGLADHRVGRRRPVHRPPGVDRGEQALLARHAPAWSGSGRLPDVSCRRRSIFRTPGSCCRSASSCSPAGLRMQPSRYRLSPARADRAANVLRQPQRRRAVPSRLFRIPADTFQLFLATGVVNSRVGTLVAAIHTSPSPCSAPARSAAPAVRRPPPGALPRYHDVADHRVIGGARSSSGILRPDYTRDQVLARCTCCSNPAGRGHSHHPLGTSQYGWLPTLARIRNRGALRAGYMPRMRCRSPSSTRGRPRRPRRRTGPPSRR